MPSILPEIDPSSAATSAEQISRFYEGVIEDGRVPVGDRLPPIREVAANCQVTRATVQDAYRRLADRGLVEGTVGRGTVVLAVNHGDEAEIAPRSRVVSPYAEAALRRTKAMAGPRRCPLISISSRTSRSCNPTTRFPIAEWRTAMDTVLERQGRELLGYGRSAFGLADLRDLLARRTHDSDPQLTADHLLVTAGAQQALDLVLRTVCSIGDTVVVTQPRTTTCTACPRARVAGHPGSVRT